MSRNLHKYYYKDYFGEKPEEIFISDNRQGRRKENKSLDWTDIKSEENASILKKRNTRLTEEGLLYKINKPVDTEDAFPLEIIYPGLVTGIGINHEATIEGEFKLGVHFDWTHGMPVVYGSSVKGVLKSAFKDGYVDKSFVNQANKNKKSETEKVPEWVGDKANKDIIIRGIFEGKDVKGKNLSIYNRDVFFDAVIIEPDTQGRILCSDSITPHGDNPLKNPIPLTFLKIAPGCKLEFRFKLTDSDFGGGKTLTAAQKKTLFEEILKTVGVGAKTNVGYGQLTSVIKKD